MRKPVILLLCILSLGSLAQTIGNTVYVAGTQTFPAGSVRTDTSGRIIITGLSPDQIVTQRLLIESTSALIISSTTTSVLIAISTVTAQDVTFTGDNRGPGNLFAPVPNPSTSTQATGQVIPSSSSLTTTPTSTGTPTPSSTSTLDTTNGVAQPASSAVSKPGTNPDTSTTATNQSSSTTTNAPSQTSTSGATSSPSGFSGSSAIGAVVAFALLWLIALFVIGWLLYKRRKDKSSRYNTEDPHANDAYAEKSRQDAAKISTLDAELKSANAHVTELQKTLLIAGHKKPTKDDNTLVREWNQIASEIKTWANQFFRDANSNAEPTNELHQLLSRDVADYPTLLSSGKTKILVVRAVVASALRQSFQENEFFGESIFSSLNSLVRKGASDPVTFNNWRSETCTLLEKSSDFQARRDSAVEAIANKIEGLCYPLASTNCAYRADPARYQFLLERIVQRASALAVDFGKQRANFQVLSKSPNTAFTLVDTEDVLQQYDTVQQANGQWTNAAEGKPIIATIFPLLIKYGNESGEGYERATIVSKAKVFV